MLNVVLLCFITVMKINELQFYCMIIKAAKRDEKVFYTNEPKRQKQWS